MKKNKTLIAILLDIYADLKKAKLAYFMSSDKAIFPEDKRHFNTQQILRNRFLQEIQAILQSKNIILDHFDDQEIRFNSLPLNKGGVESCEKCIQIDRDLIASYQSIEALGMMDSVFYNQLEKINAAVEKNQSYLEKFALEA